MGLTDLEMQARKTPPIAWVLQLIEQEKGRSWGWVLRLFALHQAAQCVHHWLFHRLRSCMYCMYYPPPHTHTCRRRQMSSLHGTGIIKFKCLRRDWLPSSMRAMVTTDWAAALLPGACCGGTVPEWNGNSKLVVGEGAQNYTRKEWNCLTESKETRCFEHWKRKKLERGQDNCVTRLNI